MKTNTSSFGDKNLGLWTSWYHTLYKDYSPSRGFSYGWTAFLFCTFWPVSLLLGLFLSTASSAQHTHTHIHTLTHKAAGRGKSEESTQKPLRYFYELRFVSHGCTEGAATALFSFIYRLYLYGRYIFRCDRSSSNTWHYSAIFQNIFLYNYYSIFHFNIKCSFPNLSAHFAAKLHFCWLAFWTGIVLPRFTCNCIGTSKARTSRETLRHMQDTFYV